MMTGSFPGVKQPGRGVDHLPPSRAEVKEIVELYICSPSVGLRGLLCDEIYLYLYRILKYNWSCHESNLICSGSKVDSQNPKTYISLKKY
jgi:hypothetical protein